MEEVQVRSDDQQPQRQFLYADYSAIDDQRNIIKMLDDFVSLAGAIVQIHVDNQKLAVLLETADEIRQEGFLALDDIRSNTQNALDRFHSRYPDALKSDLHTGSTALLNEGCKSIVGTLESTSAGVEEQFKKYTGEIMSRIERNNTSAANLIESWLAEDYDKLPASLLDSLETEIIVSTEPGNSKSYSAHCKRSTKHWADGSHSSIEIGPVLPMSYMYRIDTQGLNFWGSPRKISDFGLRDLLLPIGMKTSISEKLKQAFRISSRKEGADVYRGPEFVKVDEYYVSSIKLDGKHESLSLELAADLSKPAHNLFEITFDIARLLNDPPYPEDEFAVEDHPTLRYFARKDGTALSETTADLFQIQEIVQASDLSKIRHCAKAIIEKLDLLQKEKIIAANGHLEFLNANGSDIFTSKDNKKIAYPALLEFLTLVAESLAPYVRILREKTPIDGELVLRQEVDRRNRKEYSVRLDDLRSRLPVVNVWGRRIADILQL